MKEGRRTKKGTEGEDNKKEAKKKGKEENKDKDNKK